MLQATPFKSNYRGVDIFSPSMQADGASYHTAVVQVDSVSSETCQND